MIRVGNQIEVWAPAKLNLFLEVVRRRSDGFHEIETLMVPVSLFDTLRFQTCESDELQVRKSGLYRGEGISVPTGSDNLVCRAVDLLRNELGVDQCASIQLVKRIPSEAGLGGGSSDAAAAMIAANSAWQLGKSMPELAQLSSQLGSDIPFFFGGTPSVCTGRGEIVRPLDVPHFHAVIVKPDVGLATRDVYQRVDLESERRSVSDLMKLQGSLSGFASRLFNRLESAAESISPWIEKLRTIFSRLGLVGHQLSGSGSSYFGICRSSRHARRVAQLLRALKIGMVYTVRRDTARSYHLATA